MPVIPAELTDIPVLVSIMNQAYRGESSKKGWTTEAGLISGELRTDDVTVKKLMQSPESIFLKYTNEKNIIEGCVFLQKKENKFYLGMLSVSPILQSRGTGKLLMAAAESYAEKHGGRAIYMKVISIRHELINWYEKLGYKKTGETEPFIPDNRFGIPTQPLEFVIMEKRV